MLGQPVTTNAIRDIYTRCTAFRAYDVSRLPLEIIFVTNFQSCMHWEQFWLSCSITSLHMKYWSRQFMHRQFTFSSGCFDSIFFFPFLSTPSRNSGWARVPEYLLSQCFWRFSTILCKASSKLYGVSNWFLRLVIIFTYVHVCQNLIAYIITE